MVFLGSLNLDCLYFVFLSNLEVVFYLFYIYIYIKQFPISYVIRFFKKFIELL